MPAFENVNPSSKECWTTCGSCYRCGDRFRYTKCYSCSGRHDPFLQAAPHDQDFCDCANGTLRWKGRDGKMIIRKYDRNPYVGQVVGVQKTEDERDWESYVHDLRERMDNPNFDPIQVVDAKNAGFKVIKGS